MSDTTITTLTDAQSSRLARFIKTDMQGMSVDMSNASVRAVRIGIALILVRDFGKHGDLEKFKREHFDKKVFRTLENHIRIAECCLNETGLRDKKTRQLNNGQVGSAVKSLIVSTKAKDPAARKVIEWINERGVWDLLQDVRNTSAAASPPAQDGKAARMSRRDQQRAAMLDAFKTFKKSFGAKHWMYLDEPDLTEMSNTLNKAQLDIGEQLRKAKKEGSK